MLIAILLEMHASVYFILFFFLEISQVFIFAMIYAMLS